MTGCVVSPRAARQLLEIWVFTRNTAFRPLIGIGFSVTSGRSSIRAIGYWTDRVGSKAA